jgi:hypothetical protein
MPQRRLLLLGLTLGALLCARSEAEAEYWAMPLGELLQTAHVIEVIEVREVRDGRARGVVREAIRGATVGGAAEVEVLTDPMPAVGSRLLVICESNVCPRAWGLDRGGWYVLSAQQPMDGAEVLPGLVTAAGLTELAAGRTAPRLCVRASVRFLDEPSVREVLRADLGASEGTGTVSGSVIGAQPRRGRLLAPHGLRFEDGLAATLKVRGARGEVAFIGGPLRRAADGCFELDVTPAYPALRTRAQLAAGLAGRRSAQVVARGTLRVTSGSSVPRGDHPIAFRIDRDAQLRVISSVLAGEHIASVERTPGHLRLGVSISPGAFHPVLELDFGARRPSLPGVSAQIGIGDMLRGRGTVSVPIDEYGPGPSGHAERRRIGTAALRYVPSP